MKKSRRIWLMILLTISGFVGLIALIIVGVLKWGYLHLRETREFTQREDARDLRARVEKMADAYLAKRPHGALVIGIIKTDGRIDNGAPRPPTCRRWKQNLH